MTFGDLFDKFKHKGKEAQGQVKLAGKIVALKVEKTTQKTEHDRLLKEIGSKTYGIYVKTKKLEQEVLMEEVVNELNHLERIDKRLGDIDAEIAQLQAEILRTGNKDTDVDAEVDDEDEEE